MVDTVGTVQYGINRIYTVEVGGRAVQCRIKGKTLRSDEREYNPLAPGDVVRLQLEAESAAEGLIMDRLDRKNRFWRWNRKGRSVQVMAANIVGVCCVCAPTSPPFRPRFVDRVIVIAEHEGIPVSVVLNKTDTGVPDAVAERLDYFERIGVSVVRCSARTGVGVDDVLEFAGPGPCAVVGQSGVGKSSLLNALDPRLSLRTGDVSAKHNRGTHVTNFGRMIRIGDSVLVDTPGIREIDLYGLSEAEVAEGFREFHEPAGACEYVPCTHTHEPGCGVKAAVAREEIHPDRYESYLRVLADLELSRRLSER